MPDYKSVRHNRRSSKRVNDFNATTAIKSLNHSINSHNSFQNEDYEIFNEHMQNVISPMSIQISEKRPKTREMMYV